jgi:hypothetical protein
MGLRGKEERMKVWLSLIGMMLCIFFLLGMGNMEQTDKVGEIPRPDKEVSVTISDSEGQVLNLTQFSLNGQIYLTGKIGAGQVAIPLDQIRLITLSPNGKEISAKLELADRTQVNVHLDKGIMAYGKIKFGTYKIALERLRKIEILGVAERKKER